MYKTRVFAGLCCMFLCAASWAQAPSDIAGVAQVIRDNYFDPAQAEKIADELLREAGVQKLDELADRNELARRLTAVLQPFDRHFRVKSEPPNAKGGNVDHLKRFMDKARASNYGFRNVGRLPGEIAVIRLTTVAIIDFNDANDPARRAADAALADALAAKAVILDLRDNGGGDTSMAGYLISAFVKPGADVYNSFHTRTESFSERPAVEYPRPNPDVPLYLLTNNRTGSAAESIAFSLQSAGRAKVIGERTGGAANPGDVFNTPQGFSVFVSTGSPKNPINGRNWEGTGVVPDVDTSSEAALDRALQLARE